MNSIGKYNIRLCKSGIWETITIDDLIPCYPSVGPIFSHTQSNQLWMVLLEKAYAKMYNSYSFLAGGSVFESLIDMTGAPYDIIRLHSFKSESQMKDEDLLYKKLLDYLDMNYLLYTYLSRSSQYSYSSAKSYSNSEDKSAANSSSELFSSKLYNIVRVKKLTTGKLFLQFFDPLRTSESDGLKLYRERETGRGGGGEKGEGIGASECKRKRNEELSQYWIDMTSKCVDVSNCNY